MPSRHGGCWKPVSRRTQILWWGREMPWEMMSSETTLSQKRVWEWDEPGCRTIRMNEWVTLVRRSFMVGRLKRSKSLERHYQQGCFSKYFTENLITLESLCLTKSLRQKKNTDIVYSTQLLLFFLFWCFNICHIHTTVQGMPLERLQRKRKNRER